MIRIEASRLREPAAWIMFAVAATQILVAVERMLIPESTLLGVPVSSFADRAAAQFFTLASPVYAALLLGAVVVTTRFGDPTPRAKIISYAAFGGLAVSSLFGVIAFLAGLFAREGARDVLEFLVIGAAHVALVLLALLYLLPQVFPARPQTQAPAGGFGYPAGGQQPFGTPQPFGAPGQPAQTPYQPAEGGQPTQGQFPQQGQPGFSPQEAGQQPFGAPGGQQQPYASPEQPGQQGAGQQPFGQAQQPFGTPSQASYTEQPTPALPALPPSSPDAGSSGQGYGSPAEPSFQQQSADPYQPPSPYQPQGAGYQQQNQDAWPREGGYQQGGNQPFQHTPYQQQPEQAQGAFGDRPSFPPPGTGQGAFGDAAHRPEAQQQGFGAADHVHDGGPAVTPFPQHSSGQDSGYGTPYQQGQAPEGQPFSGFSSGEYATRPAGQGGYEDSPIDPRNQQLAQAYQQAEVYQQAQGQPQSSFSGQHYDNPFGHPQTPPASYTGGGQSGYGGQAAGAFGPGAQQREGDGAIDPTAIYTPGEQPRG